MMELPLQDIALALAAEDAYGHLFRAEGDVVAIEPGSPAGIRVAATLKEMLRADGWTVAVANDYRLDGVPHVFYLFTHSSGVWAKGEGTSEYEAVLKAAKHAGERRSGRMDSGRAKDINDRLCQAYLITEGILAGAFPDLSDVSLADALTASRMIAADPGEVRPEGGRVLSCHVDESAIPRVLAAAIIQAPPATTVAAMPDDHTAPEQTIHNEDAPLITGIQAGAEGFTDKVGQFLLEDSAPPGEASHAR